MKHSSPDHPRLHPSIGAAARRRRLGELTRRCLSIHFLMVRRNLDIILDIQSSTGAAFISPASHRHRNVAVSSRCRASLAVLPGVYAGLWRVSR
jgi:hypothetical protein